MTRDARDGLARLESSLMRLGLVKLGRLARDDEQQFAILLAAVEIKERVWRIRRLLADGKRFG